MRKKLDHRITALLLANLKQRHRTLILLVGDRSRYQVVNFHYMISKNSLKVKPKVLWCYKKELGFSSHQKKRMKEVNNLKKKGVYHQQVDDPFELFISSSEITYCYYKESHKILGNTYQMLVLQDFEALTPNILCRAIETVEGGGIVVLLLKTMTSLKQLYTLSMDVHKRYRTQQFETVQPRFNQRFILSLCKCKSALVLDDQLNLLPVTAVPEIDPDKQQKLILKAAQELQQLKSSMAQKQVVGQLVAQARTLDQAKAILAFLDALDRRNNSIVSLTAGRGRGKSACIGLNIAGSIRLGLSSIYVTAPHPSNLKTLFQFVEKGLQLLGYRLNMDYDKVESTFEAFDNAVIRINVHKTHQQLIQYVLPHDFHKIAHADLIVIDEAAAIPLPLVKGFLGPHMMLISSTINGYQGTGRSLSLKLFSQLKQVSRKSAGAPFIQVSMSDPIRYALNDPVQSWLNGLLLLQATTPANLKGALPHPSDCELYLVNKDTLFSHQKSTQKFLFNMMSLFISSHYKNSPNDLQLLSDAPSHLIFVLLGPISQSGELPDVLAAIQLALQGNISKEGVLNSNERGIKPSGDLIPWNIRDQFQDQEFPQLAGGRVVRIAVHPAAQRMGYGGKALELLRMFFQCKMVNFQEQSQLAQFHLRDSQDQKPSSLRPLLKKLSEVRPPALNYLGTSFGINNQLFRFWSRCGYQPVYIRQSKNELTGQHSSIMILPLERDSMIEVSVYVKEFRRRFTSLLSYDFRDMDINLVISVLKPLLTTDTQESSESKLKSRQFQLFVSFTDVKRLQSYAKNLIDFHLITDLLPRLAFLYFNNYLDVRLSYTQAQILVGMGLQCRKVQEVASVISAEVSHCLALFNKSIRKLSSKLRKLFEDQVESEMPQMTQLGGERAVGRDLQAEQKGEEAIRQLYKQVQTPVRKKTKLQ